jgi:hypothetical protein
MGLGRTSGPPAVGKGSSDISAPGYSLAMVPRTIINLTHLPLVLLHSWQQRGDSGKSNYHRDDQSDYHQNPTGQQHNLAYQLRLHDVIPVHCGLLSQPKSSGDNGWQE